MRELGHVVTAYGSGTAADMAEQTRELVATYPDGTSARAAIAALERRGVDAAHIDLVEAPGARAPATDDALAEPDEAVIREVGTRSVGGLVIGALLGGALAALVAWFVADGSTMAMAIAIAGAAAGGGALGFFYGGASALSVSEEWADTFATTGQATLAVVVPDEAVVDIREVLEHTKPVRITVS
jgi:hypothetical protein